MTSFGQSNSKVYSFSHWVSGGAIVVRSEISGAAGWRVGSRFVHAEFPPEKVGCANGYRPSAPRRSWGWGLDLDVISTQMKVVVTGEND